jgi:hypothetical protein
MKLYQLAITLLVLVFLREVIGEILMRLTGLAVLANFGGLAISSFLAGWLAGAISELGPSRGQIAGLAALGVIASIGIGLIQGVQYLALAIAFMLILNTAISCVCFLLGASFAELGIETPTPHQQDEAGSGRDG